MRVVLREKAKWFNKMRAADRCPEKAGVGGSIPSLATTFSSTYRLFQTRFHSDSFQNFGLSGLASEMRLVLVHIHVFSVPLQFPGLF